MKSFLSPILILCLAGCGSRGAATPALAHTRLVAAAAAHDSATLWDALDLETRWSWMTIQRAWREAFDITHSVVPEGPERTRLLARFEPGATSENAQALFARMLSAEEWAKIQTLVTTAGSRLPPAVDAGETSELATDAGPLRYRKGHGWRSGWGYAGLAASAEQLKYAATADLERMRKDAADYERAAARGSR
jgi:hypothetical protein